MEQLLENTKYIKLLTSEEEIMLSKKIQGWKNLQDTLREENREPSSAERTAMSAGKEAYDTLVLANIRLGVRCARKYSFRVNPTLSMDDLVQEANLGLMRAALTYDPEKGTRFSTYCVYWIEQFIRRAIEDKGDIIRKPASVHSKLRKIKKAEREIMNSGQSYGSISRNRISRETGFSEKEVQYLQEADGLRVSSLDDCLSDPDDEGFSRYDSIASDYDIQEEFDYEEQMNLVEKMASNIEDPLKQKIIRLGLGLNNEHMEMPPKRIAYVLNIDESFVNRTLQNTLNMWRQPFYYRQFLTKET